MPLSHLSTASGGRMAASNVHEHPAKDEVMSKLRRRYLTVGREHKRKLIDEAVALLGCHRKSATRALRKRSARPLGVVTGRPREYDAQELRPVLRAHCSGACLPLMNFLIAFQYKKAYSHRP